MTAHGDSLLQLEVFGEVLARNGDDGLGVVGAERLTGWAGHVEGAAHLEAGERLLDGRRELSVADPDLESFTLGRRLEDLSFSVHEVDLELNQGSLFDGRHGGG